MTCILLFVSFVVSPWFAFGCNLNRFGLVVGAGAAMVGKTGMAKPECFSETLRGGEVFWMPGMDYGKHYPFYYIPLWMPFVAIAVPTFIAFRRDRRPPPGHCKCGYDLTGNESGVCPECGTAWDDKHD